MMNEDNSNNTLPIYWDDAHITTESETLPAPMREMYIWLKTHLRDACKKDLDVLTEKFRDRGVTVDKTNWARIVKGRWRIDTRGFETTPCISQQNFIQSVTALRDEIRVELLQGAVPFIETSTVKTIWNFIGKKMRKDRVNRWGMIVGPTGTQKTASYKELAQRNRFVKWIEAPDSGSVRDFAVRLAVKFGGSTSMGQTKARSKLFDNVTREHCIIVDNTQELVLDTVELMKASRKDHYSQPAYNFMRSLQDETGCVIIWSITPENEDQMFSATNESQLIYNEQYEGRCGGVDGFLRLPNYSPKRDIVQITEAMGFSNVEPNADRLHEISKERGRIRRYFEILQEAKDLADDAKVRPTIKHIDLVMERIAEDAARRSDRKKGAAK